MYVISLITEYDVKSGGCYDVIPTTIPGVVHVVDDAGDSFVLSDGEYVWSDADTFLKYQSTPKSPNELNILRERIKALQEENAELKFRLDSLEK